MDGGLQKKCFDIVLELWQHKSRFPSDSLPFRDYTSVFNTLKRIDPPNATPFYIREISETSEDIKPYIDMPLLVDKTVRIWFDYIFKQAIKATISGTSLRYLEATVDIDDNSKLLYELMRSFDEDLCDADDLRKNIDVLTRFSKFNDEMIECIKDDLSSYPV